MSEVRMMLLAECRVVATLEEKRRRRTGRAIAVHMYCPWRGG